jgi:hypothetical protein
MLTHLNVLFLQHSHIFSKLDVYTETVPQKYKFIMKFVDKNPIFKIDYIQKTNSSVIKLKFKQILCALCLCLQMQGF